MKRYLYILVLLALACSTTVFGQNVMLLTSRQGLSNSCIRNIYEDKHHNIWITTMNGLNRYDGVKLNVYRHDNDDPHSLAHDESTCVLDYDKTGVLVGTMGGIQLYDYETDRFTDIPFIRQNGDTINPRVITIAHVKDQGYVACAAGYGAALLEKTSQGLVARWTDAFDDGPKEKVSPAFMIEDKKDNLWIINGHRLLLRRVGGSKGKVVYYDNLSEVTSVCMTTSGKVYAGTYNKGLYVYDDKADRFVLAASSEEVGGLLEKISPWTDGRLFLCTDGSGLRVFDENTGKVSQSTIRVSDFDMARSNVRHAISDSFGNVWVGVYWRGVMIKSSNQSFFEYVGHLSFVKNTIGNNPIFAISEAKDGNLWVAIENDGLYHLSPDGTSSTHFSPSSHPGMPVSFTNVLQTKDGSLLLGTWNDGLWTMKDGRFTHVTSAINNIFEIRPSTWDGKFWVSTMGNGFFLFDAASRQWKQYSPDWSRGEEGTKIIGNPYVYTLLQVGTHLYVGTADGLTICNVNMDGTITQASHKVLRYSSVRYIVASEDKKTVWVATNKGLVRLDDETMNATSYTTADGLPNNSIMSLELDGKYLWVSTGRGLACMDTTDGTCKTFFQEDGLQDNEFNRGASVRMGGHLYFGGLGGLTYFNPKDVLRSFSEERKLRLTLVDVAVKGKTVHVGDLSDGYEILQGMVDEAESVELSYKENFLAVELCIEGLHNQHVEYEYSVNGGPWVTQGVAGNRLFFENLPVGENQIRMRALAFGSVSGERVLTVVVHPAWYASEGAFCVYIIVFLLLCWGVYEYVKRRVEARRLMAQHLQQEKINEARIQFFMNISHEIRTPMTLIIAPLEKLMRSDKNQERQATYRIIKQNSMRILRLVNQMMDVRKIEKGQYNLDLVDTEIVSFVRSIYDVFLVNARTRNINYRFSSNVDRYMVSTDKSSIDKILMNLLSNAFKFTPDEGEVSLDVEAVGTDFVLRVSDSGIGIKDEDKERIFQRFYSAKHQNGYVGTGIGLNLVSLLVHLHGGAVRVEDNVSGKGVSFIVTLPIGEVEAQDDVAEVERTDAEAAVQPEGTVDAVKVDENVEPVAGDGGQKEGEETHNVEEAADVDTGSKTVSAKTTSEGESVDVISANGSESIDVMSVNGSESIDVMGSPKSLANPSCVVLVEDDEAIRMFIQSEMSDSFALRSFANGQEAWDYVVAHGDSVDCVVSDIMMPVMDGMTLCQMIKSNVFTNHIPVVLMTALGDDSTRIAGITNGADAYMSKPFNIDVMRSTILQLIQTRKLLHGKFQADKHVKEDIEHVDVVSNDELLMKRVMKAINSNIDNPDLSVEAIADKIGLSRVHLYRKLKTMTGQSPRDFIKYVRIKEAARLLSERNCDVTSVSIATGFKTVSNFSAVFKSLYGMTPTEWAKRSREK